MARVKRVTGINHSLVRNAVWTSKMEFRVKESSPTTSRCLYFLLESLKILGIRLQIEETDEPSTERIFNLSKLWKLLIWLMVTSSIFKELLTITFFESTMTEILIAIFTLFGTFVWGVTMALLNKNNKNLSNILRKLDSSDVVPALKCRKDKNGFRIRVNLAVLCIWSAGFVCFILELSRQLFYGDQELSRSLDKIEDMTQKAQTYKNILQWFDICLVDLFMLPAFSLSIALFSFSCVLLSAKFKEFNENVNSLTFRDITATDMRNIRVRHHRLCRYIDDMNCVFSTVVPLWYMVIILNIYCITYILIENYHQKNVLYFVGPWLLLSIFSSLLNFFLLSEPANGVARDARALLPTVYFFTQTDTNRELYREVHIFISRLNGPSIGLNGADAFVITRSFTFSVIGAAVSFLAILLQMNPDIKRVMGI